jgi:hypothetical protein
MVDDLVLILDAGSGKIAAPHRLRHALSIFHYCPRSRDRSRASSAGLQCDTGPTFWRSTSRDNVIIFYGYDAASRVANPAQSGGTPAADPLK